MVVSFPEKKKAKKFIEEGGESPKKREKEEVVFSLRLPIKVAEKIDKNRKMRPGKISRNTWILEVIESWLESNANF